MKPTVSENENNSGLLIYQTKSGLIQVNLKFDQTQETFWATQAQIAEIFDSSVSNISEHITKIYSDGELLMQDTFREFRNVSNQPIKHYNLDMMIAIGYRVNSKKATQFRIWATKILQEYIVKGFVMDDERLKDPKKSKHFDELLARIREIRASEKMFYQKVKDIYTLAGDYDKTSEQAKVFFKTVQNKMIYAVTGKTAAELIVERCNENLENMGLTSWEGSRVRKVDVDISKNYLTNEELEILERIVTMFIDFAELQILRRKVMQMKDWEVRLDEFLRFNEYSILNDAGKVSHDDMKKIVDKKYESFNSQRKLVEKQLAEQEAKEDFKEIEKEIVQKYVKKPKP